MRLKSLNSNNVEDFIFFNREKRLIICYMSETKLRFLISVI
jgi:hypothetical protein